jgi:hypothetical protein
MEILNIDTRRRVTINIQGADKFNIARLRAIIDQESDSCFWDLVEDDAIVFEILDQGRMKIHIDVDW